MNEIDREWQVWAERCAVHFQSQSNASHLKPECLDQSTSGLRCRAASSPSASNGWEPNEDAGNFGTCGMERCTQCGSPRFEETHSGTTASGRLETMPSEQVEIGERTKASVYLRSEMKVSDFVSMINSAGFGDVLSERNILRQRRAYRAVDAGRGRINVVAYIAAMIARRSRRRRTEDLSVKDLETLLESQGFRCALTGESLTPENVALDHIVPISEGGGFTADNSQLVTRAANRAKHTMSQRDFVSLCRRVSRTHTGK